MLSLLARLLKAINSDSAPGQVAFAFALSMIVGFTPLWSFLNLFVLLIVLLVRINVSAFLFGVIIFSILGYLVDPISAIVGETILTHAELNQLWTDLYQNEWARVLAFNNTITMGGLVIALILLLPMTAVSRMLILQYRHRLLAYVNRLKIVQVLKASKFWALYTTFAG